MAVFQAGRFALPLHRTYVMGILNVTPDSFSDGGRYRDPQAAVAHALEMARDGADIIDIGGSPPGRGTRPSPRGGVGPHCPGGTRGGGGHGPACVRGHLLPLGGPKGIGGRGLYPQRRDGLWGGDAPGGGVLPVRVRGHGPRHHRRGHLRPGAGVFLDRLQAARKLGIAPERLCFDPGVGFGKTLEENLALLAHVERTKVEGCAFLMAASRKRVTGAPCGNPPFQERLPATLAAHTAAILGGADMVRVHDVKEAVQAAKMADALKGA